MNILTPTEISECLTGGLTAVVRAIEQAVIRKLAEGVSVEPCIYEGDASPLYEAPTGYTLGQLNTAIAAARVQAENEALRTDIAGWNSAMGEANADIEALRTANAKPRANIEKTGAMHTAVRNALMHHKLTSRPDGVIESDLIYAVLDCIKGEQG